MEMTVALSSVPGESGCVPVCVCFSFLPPVLPASAQMFFIPAHPGLVTTLKQLSSATIKLQFIFFLLNPSPYSFMLSFVAFVDPPPAQVHKQPVCTFIGSQKQLLSLLEILLDLITVCHLINILKALILD